MTIKLETDNGNGLTYESEDCKEVHFEHYTNGYYQFSVECPTCEGEGKLDWIENDEELYATCRTCAGEKRVWIEEETILPTYLHKHTKLIKVLPEMGARFEAAFNATLARLRAIIQAA